MGVMVMGNTTIREREARLVAMLERMLTELRGVPVVVKVEVKSKKMDATPMGLRQQVMDALELDVAKLKKKRYRPGVAGKMVAALLIKKHFPDMSFKAIGKLLGAQDHT